MEGGLSVVLRITPSFVVAKIMIGIGIWFVQTGSQPRVRDLFFREIVGFHLATAVSLGLNAGVRAHGVWTYEPRQGRNAATVVCSVLLWLPWHFFSFFRILNFFGSHPTIPPLISCIPSNGSLQSGLYDSWRIKS